MAIPDFDFQTEDYSAIAQEVVSKLTAELEDAEVAAYDARDAVFDAEADMFADAIEASQQPGLTLEESTEVMAGLSNRHRLKLAEKQNAETNLVITETAVISEKSRFNLAKRDVLTQDVANEGKRLIMSTERGKLIDEKTLGLALQGVTQQVLNSREFNVIQLEMEKTEAIIQGTVADIEAIRSSTETKMLRARDAALKAAGVDGSYENVI
ncbi:MAG: hypothetical protein DCF25_19725 [Leptolyngbya foveolarum]|uniref:Uncharacterized protein n=1 Tax=Leptolyngbya foveolarum TaxID=47253 RepID=A0A2W4TR41_9CYAN|nr:MAG: hypothetical protein DCF25_19725 [Leptolyngbya foveolarum]